MAKCFLCNNSAKVVEFSSETLQKCYYMMLFRKQKNFKYCEAELSNNLEPLIGYHKDCFKKFTALSCKYKQEFLTMVKNLNTDKPISVNNPSINAKENSTVAVNISSDSFEKETIESSPPTNKKSTQHKTCIFCNHVSKKVGQRKQQVSTCNSIDLYNKIRQDATSLNDMIILEKLKYSKNFPYHASCKMNYQKKLNTVKKDKRIKKK